MMKYVFEIGGKDKSRKQIEGIENSFIAADDIEYGFRTKYHYGCLDFVLIDGV
jgi:hypothetical protein